MIILISWRCGRGLFLAARASRHLDWGGRNGRSERPGRTHPSCRTGNGEGDAARDARRRLPTSCGLMSRKRPRRRPAETPGDPASDKPAGRAAPPRRRMPRRRNPGKRKFVLMGVVALLALAAVGYGVHLRSGRTLLRLDRRRLCARQQHHARRAGVGPYRGDPSRRQRRWSATGDVIFRIDDGDYRIAVDAARSKIATQQATIDRIGRQVTALESAVEQAKAQLASAEAALKRAGLDFDRQQALSTKGFASRADLRSVRSRARSGRGGGEGRRRRPMTPRATMSR